MTATVETILAETRKRMKTSLETLKKEMATVRTGRANGIFLPHILRYNARRRRATTRPVGHAAVDTRVRTGYYGTDDGAGD